MARDLRTPKSTSFFCKTSFYLSFVPSSPCFRPPVCLLTVGRRSVLPRSSHSSPLLSMSAPSVSTSLCLCLCLPLEMEMFFTTLMQLFTTATNHFMARGPLPMLVYHQQRGPEGLVTAKCLGALVTAKYLHCWRDYAPKAAPGVT